MQSASIVLALCLLAKASADSSSYGSGSGPDTTEACAAAQDEYDAAQGDTTYTCLDADGAELEGDCDISGGAIPEDTATIEMDNDCVSVSIDWAAMMGGDEVLPTVEAGPDACGEACTAAINGMSAECAVDEENAMDVAVAEDTAAIVATCDSATMAGAALALIAVALF
jgi:hypothetical protein